MSSLSATPRRVRASNALVVDDDNFMLSFITDLLRDLGVQSVKTARNGQDGLRSYEQSPVKPDVVLCDLNMPEADGFQFMELLAERRFAGGVVLVSGMDARTLNSAALMARFHRLNILGTLTKPVRETELAEALAKLG
jgi:CheY-like chemotaxis protein